MIYGLKFTGVSEDLKKLAQIEVVHGSLIVSNNTNIKNLEFLRFLRHIGDPSVQGEYMVRFKNLRPSLNSTFFRSLAVGRRVSNNRFFASKCSLTMSQLWNVVQQFELFKNRGEW